MGSRGQATLVPSFAQGATCSACLPPSLSAAGRTACRSPCQPPGQTGLAGCLLAGGAVTQLLPGPGQTALRSAKLQSEDLNQAKPHPAKRRTVLGAGGGRLPPPQVLSHSGVWRLEGAPPRGAVPAGGGAAREPVATFLPGARSPGPWGLGAVASAQTSRACSVLSRSPRWSVALLVGGAKSGRTCVTIVVTSLSQNTS